MYAELLDLFRQEGETMKIRYAELYRIFCMVLDEATAQSGMDFSGPLHASPICLLHFGWNLRCVCV